MGAMGAENHKTQFLPYKGTNNVNNNNHKELLFVQISHRLIMVPNV